MTVTARVLRYGVREVLRGRWLLAYGLFFLLLTEGLVQLGGVGTKTLLSLTTAVLVLVPMVALVLGAVHVYNAREFNELLLSQPVGRGQLFVALYLSLAGPLAAALVAGIGTPFLVHGVDPEAAGPLAVLLASGLLLTAIFTALAFLVAVGVEEKARGMGVALVVWLGLAVLWDGAVLLGVRLLADHPIERAAVGATLLNPIDLARVLLLLRMDVSAFMGYTGAVFQRFFGSATGTVVTLAALAFWVAAPLLLAKRRFERRDF